MSPAQVKANVAAGRMKPPKSGVTIRMYRQGHGDCFLLCLPKTDAKNEPFYMLIDCGLWSKSEINKPIHEVIANIATATGGFIDVVLVTHEHMDHVNGFAKKDPVTGDPCFKEIKIGELWLAWTEDPTDKMANELRDRFNDTVLALAGTEARLGRAVHTMDSPQRHLLRNLLSFEVGDENAEGAAASDELISNLAQIRRDNPSLSFRDQANLAVDGITNKKAIKSLRDKLNGRTPTYLNPEKGPYEFQGVENVRVYALGPPRNAELLLSLDPKGDEEFHLKLDGSTRSFAAALNMDPDAAKARCFPARFGITRGHLDLANDDLLKQRLTYAYGSDTEKTYTTDSVRDFFSGTYGSGDAAGAPDSWRRIDDEWLQGSDSLALRLNNEVNNTSAVVALELTGTGKVLLFSGDAQRGSWISWSTLSWEVNEKKVTSRELLGRTVFYKVGHHGSHNATLNGVSEGETANLSWLGLGTYAEEFVAVIPANEAWALAKQGWHHPLKSIESELIKKARGRVFRSDTDRVKRPANIDESEWAKFKRVETDLYFEYTVPDA